MNIFKMSDNNYRLKCLYKTVENVNLDQILNNIGLYIRLRSNYDLIKIYSYVLPTVRLSTGNN